MDKTYLSDNIHLIRMAVDFWLTDLIYYGDPERVAPKDVLEMRLFQKQLEKDVSE